MTETGARALLEAWRERQADRLDPLRFHFIDALARRAEAMEGAARGALDERVAGLLRAYAEDLERSEAGAGDDAEPDAPARGALGELLEHIASLRPADTVASAAPGATAPPELQALEEARKIWSRLRLASQARQSLEQVPENAGPLNSGSLMHRSLNLMRDLAPGYLQRFLAYVDTLSWMAQMAEGAPAAGSEAPRPAGGKRRARAKPGQQGD